MLTEAMKRQFNSAFDVLEAAAGSFTPDQWRDGSAPFNGPCRAVVHVLQCAEFYTCEDKGVFTNLGRKVWELPDEELPSQEQMSHYLAEAREKTSLWIDSIGDEGLGKDVASRGDGDESIGLDRLAYALRHLQHHTGEVCAYQKQCGLEPAPWK
ncbi:hypothetical protein LCGC14_1919860 [marine sediment metagenome]|uniref:DinB-like domain-containing protein n=1 Tax=marine sediment metagenome TaxID=412755 RepID=A0A0F9FRW1_9ZZZZ